MSSDQYDVVVAEYLQEIEQRLHGLPVLQRRELLGDLEAHIATERAERGVSSEADLLHVLERLGAPAVVAAAAYEEAGLPQPAVPAAAVGSAPGPAAVAPGGTVTFAASSRFSGWAERTASIGGAA
ncbi:HAAS signaling domain-containing protein, partial [Couchioplanes caeruleus]